MLAMAEAEIGHYYPSHTEGGKSSEFRVSGFESGVTQNAKPKTQNAKPIAYYWARVGTCSNPSCRAEVPLLKGFYLCNTNTKHVYLKPIIKGNLIEFEIKKGKTEEKGWMDKSSLKCPICGGVTNAEMIREQVASGQIGEKMIAVITSDENGKSYRLPFEKELEILKNLPEVEMPSESLPNATRLTGGFIVAWGYTKWGQMFSQRQLIVLQSLVKNLNLLKKDLNTEGEYGQSILSFLGILLDRGAAISNTFGRWDISRENVQSPFSKQAIPMIFDYPEANLLGQTTGSLINQLDWIIRYIDGESPNPFKVICNHSASGEKEQFDSKYLTAVITDPPYYDSIAYADLSDFFYVWLKRTLGDVYPLNFATPQTPKTDECTALKHHHNGNKNAANQHFEKKLKDIFDAIEHQTSDIVSIMFAHQSTEAWTTLCNSIIGARMNITGSWAIDTEMANRSLGLAGAVLESSVTVACRPSVQDGYGDFRDIKREIESTVESEVEKLYGLGLRGADLLTACFGQAVSVFGKYKSVEKADGSEVTVKELLDIARDSAFNALLRGFKGDDFTKFYIGWLQLYGFAESGFDDAAQFSRVGLSVNVSDLFKHNLFVKNGNKQTLSTYIDRLNADKGCGERRNDDIIDQVHRAMFLWKSDRNSLLRHLNQVGADTPESAFWRVITSLCERDMLPNPCDDRKQAEELLTNRDNLIKDSKNVGNAPLANQTRLEL